MKDVSGSKNRVITEGDVNSEHLPVKNTDASVPLLAALQLRIWSVLGRLPQLLLAFGDPCRPADSQAVV